MELELEKGLAEYFFVDRRDLISLVKATEGRVADWDQFTHLLLEGEFCSSNWQKIEVNDLYLIFDNSGLDFKATDAEGFD